MSDGCNQPGEAFTFGEGRDLEGLIVQVRFGNELSGEGSREYPA